MPTLLFGLGVVVPSRTVAQVTTARPVARPAARPGPADPDVYLLPLMGRGDALKIGVPANVSRRAGYDNQPAFQRDSRALYFTSNRGDGQSDIYRNDFSTGLTAPLRATKPESEYSAFPTLDGKSITVIRVEADSTQRLAQFPTDGSAPTVLFPAIKPVGYFAQADDSTWAMFVLGSPATLQLARTGAGREQTTGAVIASNVGRSLHRIPGTAHVSYVQKGGAAWYVMQLDPVSRGIDTLIALPTGSEDVAWVDSTTLLVGRGTQVMQWRRGTTAWTSLGDLAFAHLANITRLAVSPNGQWLALVAEPQARTAVPLPAAANMPVDRIDAASVKRNIGILAADSMEGRLTGSRGQERAAIWLETQYRADDDASGNVALIEMAKALMKGPRPKRTILFMSITGEEVGGFGTSWYIRHPLLPLEKTVVDLNVEMIAHADSLAGGRTFSHAVTMWSSRELASPRTRCHRTIS